MKALRFLIVEDHQFQRNMLEHALRELGAEHIVGVGNGLEALRVLQGTAIDIVITDLMMPDVDGIELLPKLRNIAGVSVILSSADATSLDVATAIAKAHGIRLLGAIHKPITPDRLAPLLDAYLGAA